MSPNQGTENLSTQDAATAVPYFEDHDVTLLLGDAREVLATLAPGSVNCVVTSPPYFGLRDYGVDGQVGLEASPGEYVEKLVDILDLAGDAMTNDGVMWLNLGDTYFSGKGAAVGPDRKQPARRGFVRPVDVAQEWGRPKNLIGIPWKVAFALQDRGWTLRKEIIWHKPNAMPESVTDRVSSTHENVFLLSKNRNYWFDLDAIREPYSAISLKRYESEFQQGGATHHAQLKSNMLKDGGKIDANPLGKNPGDVWSIPTAPFPGAHFATMPPELARRCILAGCPEGGTVLDPFNGSGTTAMVARRLGRKAIGIDLNPAYLDIAVQRIGDTPFDFGGSV